MRRSHTRRTPAVTALALIATLAALAGCAVREEVPPAPVLTLLDSIVLADTGVLALGDLANAGLHVGDQEIWVGDPQGGRVVRFDRRGRTVGVTGGKGKGPGELMRAGPLAATGDDGVAVWDYGANKVVAYDAGTGATRWQVVVRGQALPLQLQATGDTVWLGVVSLTGNTGAMRVARGDSLPHRMAPVPAEYAAGLGFAYPTSVALRAADALLVGYAGDRRIYLHHDGGAVDTVEVPRRLRRGVPPDILDRLMAQRGKADAVPSENMVSTLARMVWLADGSVALVHYDVDFDVGSDAPATTDLWLTVLDRDLGRACVDASLPQLGRGLPSLAFRGDTLYTLEQVVEGERAEPVLRSYVISTSGCGWMPTT